VSDQSRNTRRGAHDVGTRAGQHGLRTALIIVVIVLAAGFLVWQTPSGGNHLSDRGFQIGTR